MRPSQKISGPAEFLPCFKDQGFDPDANPPWQMVPGRTGTVYSDSHNRPQSGQ